MVAPMVLIIFWVALWIMCESGIQWMRYQNEYWPKSYELLNEEDRGKFNEIFKPENVWGGESDAWTYPWNISKDVSAKVGSLLRKMVILWLEENGHQSLARNYREVSRLVFYIELSYQLIYILCTVLFLIVSVLIINIILKNHGKTYSQTFAVFAICWTFWIPIDIGVEIIFAENDLYENAPSGGGTSLFFYPLTLYVTFRIVYFIQLIYFYTISHNASVIRSFAAISTAMLFVMFMEFWLVVRYNGLWPDILGWIS